MNANSPEVFEKTLHTTQAWLDEIAAAIGPDRRVAWHALGAVLHALRDRLPLELAVHLGAQLPLLIRGAYYEQWRPADQPAASRHFEAFVAAVAEGLGRTRPVNPAEATAAVFRCLARHVDAGQITKTLGALPQPIREALADAAGL